MQYVCNLTRFTRLSITSHSQPLINAKHKLQVTNYLQTIFQTITNEPIGLIILITSWLTINIAPFTLGQMNIINPQIERRCIQSTYFPWNGTSLFTFSWPVVRRRLYSHFPARHSHNLQFREFQSVEWSSR
jgi:hypothetical protein